MAIQKRILAPNLIDLLPGLPPGLRRQDASDYVLSRTFARSMGKDLPRREVLQKLAATLAITVLPTQPACAVPLALVTISAVSVGAAAIKVFRNTFGEFHAKNNEPAQSRGYVSITVFDQNSDVSEGGITARYSFPANTNVIIAFTKGPAATTKGDKRLTVAAEDSIDEDEFEAV